jgi:hypothetical protein
MTAHDREEFRKLVAHHLQLSIFNHFAHQHAQTMAPPGASPNLTISPTRH